MGRAERILEVLIIGICALGIGAWESRSQSAAPPAPFVAPAGVEIKVEAQPPKATVGDPIRIDIDVAYPAGIEVRLQPLDTRLGDFAVLESSPGPLPADPGAKSESPRHHRARIVVAVYKTGDFEFPPLSIVLRSSDGKETAVKTPPVKVRIDSVLQADDTNLKDLKKQAEIDDPFPWRTWAILGGAFLVLAAAIAIWLRHRRRRPAGISVPARPDLSPLELAEIELRDLLSRGLLEKGFVKQFYVTLSESVKKMLEGGYGISTAEKTTAEIMHALQSTPAGPAGSQRMERIESLLLECDLVKFARYMPAREESDSAVTAAFAVLQDCKERRSAALAGEAPVTGAS